MAKQEQVVKIIIDTGQAKSAVGGINKQLDKTSKSAKSTGKGLAGAFGAMKQGILGAIPALKAFSAALISTGVGAIVVAVGSLVSMFVSAARKGAEFEKALSGLEAVSGATAEEMDLLSTQAKQLGASTAFTASQVIQLQTELAKLGFTTADIANSTPAILDLAASLEVDLASAAEFAGSVVRSFGLTTEETQRVVDVMSLSTASSALNFDALRESLKVAAPTARAVGVSVEKTAALLGVLADTGLKGSIAGTGLSKTFIQLNKEGISLEDAMDKVRNSSNQLGTAIDLAGVVGGRALLNLANSGDKIGELEEKFNNAGGAAKDIAETRLDNLAGDTTKLASAWEGFLLSIEDGDGILNKISRGAIQVLTAAIQGLTDYMAFMDFAFKDAWSAIKETTGATVDVVGGLFGILGGKIKTFANKALLQIARIPIIGRMIDKDAARKRIKEAADAIDEAEERIRKGRERAAIQNVKNMTFMARFRKSQETKAILSEQKKQNEALEELQKQQDEEDKKREEERLKQREKDLEKIAKLEEKYIKKSEDLTDTTNLAKVQRQRERGIKEIEDLVLTEEEKRKALEALNNFYDEKEAEAKKKDDEKELEERQKKQGQRFQELNLEKEFEQLTFDERRQILAERRQLLLDDELLSEQHKQALLAEYAKAEEQLDRDKVASKQEALQAVANIAGAESRVGAALLAAKQALALKETLQDIKRITFKGAQAIGEAGVSTAQNVANSSKIGFPQNIITIAGAVAQGISIIGQVKKAVGKTKAGAAAAGGASPPTIGRQAEPSETQAPAFNIIGSSPQSQIAEAIGGQSERPVKAYVTSTDVSTGQALERNIIEGATI